MPSWRAACWRRSYGRIAARGRHCCDRKLCSRSWSHIRRRRCTTSLRGVAWRRGSHRLPSRPDAFPETRNDGGRLIDRISRDALHALLTQFEAGAIGRDELLARKPRSRDRAVREILAQASLLDKSDDALPRARHLTGEDRGEVVRWMLFLQTDAEYRWPSLPAWLRVIAVIPSILTFGLLWRPYRRWFERQGDHRVWPFLDGTEYNEAQRRKRARRAPSR